MSPAKKKPRNCSCTLKSIAFKPTGFLMCDIEHLQLFPDEVEALKHCDKDGLTQLQASEYMGISRVTVQRILASARVKVASAIVGNKALIFEQEAKYMEGQFINSWRNL